MLKLNRLIEYLILTLKINSRYKLIINDNSELCIIVGTFKSILQNEERKISGIKVARDGNPEDAVIVQPGKIKTVYH